MLPKIALAAAILALATVPAYAQTSHSDRDNPAPRR
jgi:hypothetical protein